MAATIATTSENAEPGADKALSKQKSRLWLSLLGGLASVGLCVGAVLQVSSGEPSAMASVRLPVVGAPDATAPDATAQGSSKASSAMSLYRNGHYTATGHYLTPGGNESIAVSIDVEGDNVTASAVQVEATSPTARQFQQQFRTTIASQVASRPLSALSVSRVSGASLTSLGFNDALTRIRQEAKK